MGRIDWHKWGFHRYSNTYKTYDFNLKQYEFKYCSCGKWKHNQDPHNVFQYPNLQDKYSAPNKPKSRGD